MCSGFPRARRAWLRLIALVTFFVGSVGPLVGLHAQQDHPTGAARGKEAGAELTEEGSVRRGDGASTPTGSPSAAMPNYPSRHVGGETASIVQVANLVYAGTKSSQCFADHFMIKAENESTISTSRRFHAVKLDSQEVFDFPLVIMTGEGDFSLTKSEREQLFDFVKRGGLLLASAGCSSQEWDRAFRREMAFVFPGRPMDIIDLSHPMFATVYDITELRAKHGEPRPLEGMSFDGRLGVVYSQDGLNDTEHTQGCCCCGGNELTNADEINVNLLAYALLY